MAKCMRGAVRVVWVQSGPVQEKDRTKEHSKAGRECGGRGSEDNQGRERMNDMYMF